MAVHAGQIWRSKRGPRTRVRVVYAPSDGQSVAVGYVLVDGPDDAPVLTLDPDVFLLEFEQDGP